MQGFERFVQDDDGAVTVDWVVLTSSIAVFGVLVTYYILPALGEVAMYIRDTTLAYLVFLD